MNVSNASNVGAAPAVPQAHRQKILNALTNTAPRVPPAPPVDQPRRVSVLPSAALGLALSLGLACVAGKAWPQATAQCGGRASVEQTLTGQYGETRRGMGMAANNMVMELWANADTGSWTITVTTAQGQTCLVASGQNFEPITEAPGVDG
jgi:hypothetical protein